MRESPRLDRTGRRARRSDRPRRPAAMSGWREIRDTWDDTHLALQEQAEAMVRAAFHGSRRHRRQVRLAGPEATVEEYVAKYKTTVARFLHTLAGTRTDLSAIKGHAHRDKTQRGPYLRLAREYDALAAGILAEATPVEGQGDTTLPYKPILGALPAGAVLVILGLAITALGIAWAVTSYEKAQALRDRVALYRAELEARVQASERGQVLPPSTLPEAATPGLPTDQNPGVTPPLLPQPPGGGGSWAPILVAGVLAAAGTGAVLYALTRSPLTAAR